MYLLYFRSVHVSEMSDKFVKDPGTIVKEDKQLELRSSDRKR
jgi:transcriptional accessory protein Tex/SPT6